MGKEVVKLMMPSGLNVIDSKTMIFGFIYQEDC